MNEKAITYDSYHFDIHRTPQWPQPSATYRSTCLYLCFASHVLFCFFNLSDLSSTSYIKPTSISIGYKGEVSPQLSGIAFLWVWLIIFQSYITSKWSIPPCIPPATSHHSNLQMSVGGSEVLSACLPIGPSTGSRRQRASDEEIRVSISKGQWRQMEGGDV